jgi:hypothetical protein
LTNKLLVTVTSANGTRTASLYAAAVLVWRAIREVISVPDMKLIPLKNNQIKTKRPGNPGLFLLKEILLENCFNDQ